MSSNKGSPIRACGRPLGRVVKRQKIFVPNILLLFQNQVARTLPRIRFATAFEPIISCLIPDRSPRERNPFSHPSGSSASQEVFLLKASGLWAFWASAPGAQSRISRSRKRSVPVRVHSVGKSCGSQDPFRTPRPTRY